MQTRSKGCSGPETRIPAFSAPASGKPSGRFWKAGGHTLPLSYAPGPPELLNLLLFLRAAPTPLASLDWPFVSQHPLLLFLPLLQPQANSAWSLQQLQAEFPLLLLPECGISFRPAWSPRVLRAAPWAPRVCARILEVCGSSLFVCSVGPGAVNACLRRPGLARLF